MPGWAQFVALLEYLLRYLTDLTGNLGIGIILFTIVTRLAILPLTIKQLQSSRKMQTLQPKLAELRRQYGKDQARMSQEMTKLYREEKVNPVGGCLPLVIQLPIFLGVYQAVIKLVTGNTLAPGFINFIGLNLGLSAWHNGALSGIGYLVLPILSMVLQLLVTIMAQPKIQDPQQKAMMQAFLFMPLIFGYIGFTFNQGAVLYWVTSSFLAVVQQFFVSGFGSLTNYLPFLPDRQGLFGPPPSLTPVSETATVEAAPERSGDFWAPLNKLRTSTDPTEQAIIDAKQQSKKRS